MSEILKTEAIVLSKMDYRDTSNILSLYTKDFGRISVIQKGARSPKSKKGFIAEPLNHLQIIIYKKDSRELQLLSGADLLSYFPHIKENLDKLKYSLAILELIKNLTPENETNLKLFNGLTRILFLLDTSDESPNITFGRFFLFFLKETGYQVQLNQCSSCQRNLMNNDYLGYNFELGIFCSQCSINYRIDFKLSRELFNYLLCLKQNKNADSFKNFTADRAVIFMERHLKFHIPDFKGINSFHAFR
ncbi:MAG: DNA repair protein RecO [Ignavibacteriales bacterium]|nr:MAG: DNA repair protein RecO [Ignavibacteriales bacterium]